MMERFTILLTSMGGRSLRVVVNPDVSPQRIVTVF